MGSPTHDAAVGAIYASAADPQLWPDTLTCLADYVGASGGMLAYHGTSSADNVFVVGRRREDLTELYLRHYTRNPYALRLAQLAPRRPTFTDELVPDGDIRRTAFHADILAPQTIARQVVVTHPSLTRRGTSGGFSFTLTPRQAERRTEIAARFSRLTPHLGRAVDLSLAFHRRLDEARQRVLLDALPSAALLLDGRGRIVQANDAADRLLAKADGLQVLRTDGSRLTASASSEARTLARLLGCAVSGPSDGEGALPGALRITRPSGLPPLLVLTTPMPPLAVPFWDVVEQGARALVQIIDPHASALDQANILGTAAQLTPTEARVAALIGEGLTAPEAAVVLGLAPSTVRTHLARCFDKLGVRSQVALARLLASLPVHGRSV